MASNASHGPRNLRIERQITLLEKDSKETNPTALAAKAYRKLGVDGRPALAEALAVANDGDDGDIGELYSASAV